MPEILWEKAAITVLNLGWRVRTIFAATEEGSPKTT